MQKLALLLVLASFSLAQKLVFELPGVAALTTNSAGTKLATLDRQGRVSVYDISKRPPKLLETMAVYSTNVPDIPATHLLGYYGVAVDIDSKIVVRYGKSNCFYRAAPHYHPNSVARLEVLSIPSGEVVATLESGGLCGTSNFLIGPGHLLAVSNRNGYAQIWDLKSGKRLQTILLDTWRIEQLGFSHDGNLLAICNTYLDTVLYSIPEHRIVQRVSPKNGLIITSEGKLAPNPLYIGMAAPSCQNFPPVFTLDKQGLLLGAVLWSLKTGDPLRRFSRRAGRGSTHAAMLSRNRLALSDRGGGLSVYDISSGKVLLARPDGGGRLLARGNLLVTEARQNFDGIQGWRFP